MKKMLLAFASVLAFSTYAQAESCSVWTAGEDQKLECAQEKLEKKIAKLNKLLDKVERELHEERLEQIQEGDETKAQGLALLEKAVQKIQSEILEAQAELDKLVKKHHKLDEQTDSRRGIYYLKAKAKRLKARIENSLKQATGHQ